MRHMSAKKDIASAPYAMRSAPRYAHAAQRVYDAYARIAGDAPLPRLYALLMLRRRAASDDALLLAPSLRR